MGEPVTVMVPAPPLPAPSETPPHLPPAGPSVPSVRPAAGGEARARVAMRASAVHRGLLDACGRSQTDYLAVMADAVARVDGQGRASWPAGRPGTDTGPPREAASRPIATAGEAAPRATDPPAPVAASPDDRSRDAAVPPSRRGTDPEGDAALAEWLDLRGDDLFVGLDRAPWLGDHRPDYGVAVLPMTGAIEIVAASAQAHSPGRRVIGVRDLSLRSWIVLDGPSRRLRRNVERRADGTLLVTLSAWREAARPALSRDEPVASAIVELADSHPPPPPGPPPLAAPEPEPDPYEAAELFHGPAFRLLRDLRADAGGASATVDFGGSPAPRGVLHPVALDAALQAGAVKRWGEWCGAEVGAGKCLPVRLASLSLHGPTPRGGMDRLEMRGRGVDGHPRLPVLEFWLYAEERVWAHMTVLFVAVPEGPLDAFPQRARRAHLRDRAYRPGVRVSAEREGVTTLNDEELAAAEWIPRTIQLAYGIEAADDVALAVAMREHAAARFGVHPSAVTLEGMRARCGVRPGASLMLEAAREGRVVTVRDAG